MFWIVCTVVVEQARFWMLCVAARATSRAALLCDNLIFSCHFDDSVRGGLFLGTDNARQRLVPLYVPYGSFSDQAFLAVLSIDELSPLDRALHERLSLLYHTAN